MSSRQVTVHLESSGRTFLIRGCGQPFADYRDRNNKRLFVWLPERRGWRVTRPLFTAFVRHTKCDNDNWNFTSYAMAALIEDSLPEEALFASCAVLGVRTDALPCVVHAAYRALRGGEHDQMYRNAYLQICAARDIEPDETSTSLAWREEKASP